MNCIKKFFIIFLVSLLSVFTIFIYFAKPLYQLSVSVELPEGYLSTVHKIDVLHKMGSFTPFYSIIKPLYPRISFSEHYVEDTLILSLTSIYPEDLLQLQNELSDINNNQSDLLECRQYDQSLKCRLDEVMIYELNLANIKFIKSNSNPIKIRPILKDFIISFAFLFFGLILIIMSTKYARKR